MDTIAVIDFGGQYAHLIATRIRRLGVYTEILDSETPLEKLKTYAGIILSGGPSSVYEEGAPTIDPRVFELGRPVLGICYGHQLMTQLLGGKVEPGEGMGTEFGKAEIELKKTEGIFSSFSIGETTQVWMSHGDKVTALPEGFEVFASSKDDPYSAVGDEKRHFYGIQFHTEVVHTLRGNEILSNFIAATGAARAWNLGDFIQKAVQDIQSQVKDRNVFMLISGGVDSTVAYSLLVKALGPDRVYGMLVDTGFMRQGEIEEVKIALNAIGIHNLHVQDAKQAFYRDLEGVADPEKKREWIGYRFLEVQKEVAQSLQLDPDHWLLGQGTIYPDTIESGGTKHASKIKTHHNRVPEIEALIQEGKVVEPLSELYKDEVREVGEKLGLPHDMVWRHPFPGPGLAVRILCAGTSDEAAEESKENLETLAQKVDQFLQEQGHHHLHSSILPLKSVGVQGDFRTYKHAVVLSGEIQWDSLAELSPALTNRFHDLNRVLIAIAHVTSQKLSFHLNTESFLSENRVQRLQRADKLAMDWLKSIGKDREVWQMPVVLLPVSASDPEKESIVLRPIVSEEAMTAHFAELPMDQVKQLAQKILADTSLSAVLYDITNKPPGTIEWE
jgi:GMP synthase (glutamine-hydrolysing)